MELHGAIDDPLRRLGREHLGHRDRDVRRGGDRVVAVVLRPRRAGDEEARGVELGRHVGERGLHELEVGEALAELHARRRTCASASSSARCAMPHAARADRRAEHVERAEREAEPLPDFADEGVSGTRQPSHHEAPEGVVRARRDRLEREPRRARLDEERADAALAGRGVGVGEDDEVVGDARRSR